MLKCQSFLVMASKPKRNLHCGVMLRCRIRRIEQRWWRCQRGPIPRPHPPPPASEIQFKDEEWNSSTTWEFLLENRTGVQQVETVKPGHHAVMGLVPGKGRDAYQGYTLKHSFKNRELPTFLKLSWLVSHIYSVGET